MSTEGKTPKKWISKAIPPEHKGALHKELHVPEGKKIPAKKLAKAEHSSNPKEAKRARLAETLKGFHHHGNAGPHADGVPGYDKPAHHTEMIEKMPHSEGHGHDGPSGYQKPEHHEQSGMLPKPHAPAVHVPLHRLAPSNAHGFGHAAHQRQGAHRLSGHPKAHRIGGRKK